MATVTSALPVDFSRHHMLSTSPSDPSLERTVSASSSATVHPLDSSINTTNTNNTTTTANSHEERAPSSASSSPTYESNSSSSIHKTISTAVSSIMTTESLSPPLPSIHKSRRKQEKSATSSNSHTISSSDTVKNHPSWEEASNGVRGIEPTSNDRTESSQGRRRHDHWSQDGSQDDDEAYSSLMEEDSPMQYPPVSEEDKEARAIELNLERWASEEKQRRKAQRASRIGSGNTSYATSGVPSKRRSVLGMLGSGGRTSSGLTSLYQSDATDETRREGVMGKRKSWNVMKGEVSNYNRSISMESKSDIDENAPSESRRISKGKDREGSNPFQDPSSANDNTLSAKRMSTIKPSSRAPIVTPGSAATVRHRANEKLLKGGGTVQMPSIVATDDDEEREAVRHLQEMNIDPFQSAAEVDQQRRYLLARDAAKKTLLTGEDGTPIITAAPTPIMAPIRKSMSSSKFNEIGLDDEDDAMTSDWLRQAHSRQSIEQDELEERKSWWTEWLCGCENIEEEDDQQTGRTMPG